MASAHIKTIEIATEAAYCSPGVTGIPDGTGLGAWEEMRVADLAQLVPVGEAVQTERTDSRSGLYFRAPEPVVARDGVLEEVMRRGTLTFDTYLWPRGPGGTYALHASMPLYRLLRTRLGEQLAALAYTLTPSASTATEVVVPSAGLAWVVGQLARIAPDVGGVAQLTPAQYTAATQAQDGGAVTTVRHTPGAPSADTHTVLPLTTLYQPGVGAEPAALNTCAARLVGDGWEQVAYGVVLQELSVSLETGSRALRITSTCDVGWVSHVSPPGLAPAHVYPDGEMAHALAAPLTITAAIAPPAGVAGAEVPRIASPCVDEFTLTLAWELETPGCGSSWVGRQRPEAVNLEVTVDLLLADADDADVVSWSDQWRQRLGRPLLLGLSAGDGSAGEGACVYVPFAMLRSEPRKPDLGKGFTRTALSFGAGQWTGDVVPAPTELAGSIVRIGLG